jgi:hypothetical protein
MQSWDVFLAHASPDKPRVRPLLSALRDLGLRVFFDEDDVSPGQEWDLAIPRAQRASRLTAACLSRSYEAAFYLRAEVHDGIRLHRANGHMVVPVYLDGPPGPHDVLYGLSLLQAVDLHTLGPDETARQIAATLGASAPAPAAPALPPEPVPPGTLHAALCRLTATSFGELVFHTGLPRASLLPDTVPQTSRAINLIEHATERPDGYAALVATLRALRPGIL